MARKNQKLINYHTSSKTAMPSGSSVDFGEIVVRHNAETPELLIKIGEDSFGVFQASGAVQTAINTAIDAVYDSATTFASNDATTKANKAKDDAIAAAAASAVTLLGLIDGVDDRVDTVSASLETFKTTVADTYATKTGVTSDIKDAKDSVYSSATTAAAADAKTKADTAYSSATTAAAASAETLNNSLETFKTTVADTYATKTGVTSDIKDAKDSVYSSATTAAAADAKTKADTAYSSATTAAAASAETLNNRIEAVDGKVGTLSGNVHTRIEGLKTDLTNTINEKVATAYRFQGSCTYAELASKEKVNGYVWNVTDAHDNVPAGTNYAWSEDENKWDALGGIVDLSPYATITYVDGKIQEINQTNTDLKSDIDSLSSATKTLIDEVSAATKATYATKTELEATSGSIITAYTNAIAAAKKEATDASSAYTDTQINAVITAYTQADTKLDARIDKLEAISADTQSAVQNVVVDNTDVNKITATKTDENNVVTLNFDNMVIDCGDF